MGVAGADAGPSRSYVAEITEDCWRRAGLAAGMRVLVAGSGSGEAAFLAGALVGPEGSVVGFERSRERLKAARAAADSASVENVEFCEVTAGTSLGDLAYGLAPFDAVLGRWYLAAQPDPAAELRQLSKLLRQGGLACFLEMELDYGHRTEPAVPLVNEAVGWLQAGYRDCGAQLRMVTGMSRAFLEAGLGWPNMQAYQCACGADAEEFYRTLAGDLDGLLPFATGRRREELAMPTLAARLAAAVTEVGGAAAWPPIAAGWARLG